MCRDEYSDIVLEHFMCPRNVGSMNDADGEGTCGDPGCGDSLTIYIKVKNSVIDEISFLVFGCAAAIATSSMATELAKGKTLEEALKITDEDVIEALGGLPEHKKHCSNLGVETLKKAIEDYYKKKVHKE
ncbi:iron-sulfur cluster scaffold-like protein [Acetivibrio cellulolyticus]|uniref:iron-sulfur cluster scaffold-like protein n=1 Tax=Acetivibrio cellulolyticus TaxID=35830 RepID=UPI0001E2CC97|nr:iron-sulfur cluster scaffold-like protein [Acetivibrio cellulolyticus]